MTGCNGISGLGTIGMELRGFTARISSLVKWVI
jgi:hypothetical protein